MRRLFTALLNALDEDEAKRADNSKILMAALLSQMTPADRQETVDYVAWRARQFLS